MSYGFQENMIWRTCPLEVVQDMSTAHSLNIECLDLEERNAFSSGILDAQKVMWCSMNILIDKWLKWKSIDVGFLENNFLNMCDMIKDLKLYEIDEVFERITSNLHKEYVSVTLTKRQSDVQDPMTPNCIITKSWSDFSSSFWHRMVILHMCSVNHDEIMSVAIVEDMISFGEVLSSRLVLKGWLL